jgi:hypothetical protein
MISEKIKGIFDEVLVTLFKHEMTADMLYAFFAILFVLGAIWIGSVLVYQKEKKFL